MNAYAFYAVMMFQPRSRQQVTALTQSDDLARVYRDDAVRDSEMISPKHSAMISPGTKAFWQSSSGTDKAARSIAIAGTLTPSRAP